MLEDLRRSGISIIPNDTTQATPLQTATKPELIIGMTGATGLLGRNILFEIIKQNLSQLDRVKIIILGRSTPSLTLHQRMQEIIVSDGLYYLNAPHSGTLLKLAMSTLVCIEFDIESGWVLPKDHDYLNRTPFDYFFHLAAVSDFRKTELIKNKLYKINVTGTHHVLNLLDHVPIKTLIYTGTAYSCGHTSGVIAPDFDNPGGQFRNHYEETKLIGERLIKNFATQKKISYKIFRPVGICGRAIEMNVGQICKFDLFYAWALFFVKAKMRFNSDIKTLYTHPFLLNIQVICDPNGSLNIVPVDYAAKLIWSLCIKVKENGHYHISNNSELNNRHFLGEILKEINVDGVIFTSTRDSKHPLSADEALYNRHIGTSFTPYFTMPSTQFCTKNCDELKNSLGLSGVSFTPLLLKQLLDYAKRHNFGMTSVPTKLKEPMPQ